MGRRHSKYILIAGLMLVILVPFYFFLDSNITDVVELSNRQRLKENEPDLLNLRYHKAKEVQKDRYNAAPVVPKPNFVPYPTKAKPGAPWLDTPTKLHRNISMDEHILRNGDPGVIVQTVNKTLVHQVTPLVNHGSGESVKSISKRNITSVVLPKSNKTAVSEYIVDLHEQISENNDRKHNQKGLLIGGIVLENDDGSEATPMLINSTWNREERRKDETNRSLLASEHQTTLAVMSKELFHESEKLSNTDPTLKGHRSVASGKEYETKKREPEDWRKFFEEKSEDKNSKLPVNTSAGVRAETMRRNEPKSKNLTMTDNWWNFFENPVEELENNKHVNVSLDIPLLGKKYVYPTKPRPEAPDGVDFYRRRGDNSKPKYYINAAEPKKIQVEEKRTTNPLDVFDKDVTIRPIEAWARKHYAKLDGENIVSMTLYGSDPRYTMGAIRNAELVKENFPGWKLRVYTETPSENPRYGAVPNTVLTSLRNLGTEIYFMQPGEDYIPPMMWRFLVADDLWVSRFIVRDSDARLTERDAAAVFAWVKSDKPFNCIRDHPSHAQYAVSGGMWGGKPTDIRNILRRSWRDLMRGVRSDYLQDMNFLNHIIWPKMQNHAYCSDSVSCDHWLGANPFPVARYGYEHVGQVVNEHDLGRPIDIQLLRKAGENSQCSPKDELGNKI